MEGEKNPHIHQNYKSLLDAFYECSCEKYLVSHQCERLSQFSILYSPFVFGYFL